MKTVLIGTKSIILPDGHFLDEIYSKIPTYDFLPWDIIGYLLINNNLLDYPLIDIGANIGDSYAHFRRYSNAIVFAIEPNINFFEFLQKNTLGDKNVKLYNSLYCPKDLQNKVSYVSDNNRTGQTIISTQKEIEIDSKFITIDELISEIGNFFILKSDTDGFDDVIVKDILEFNIKYDIDCPLYFFEGPNSDQIKNFGYNSFIDLVIYMQKLGYKILFFSNYGIPLAYCSSNIEVTYSIFNFLKYSYSKNMAFCHYFDILAFSSELKFDLKDLIEKILFRTP